jgi:hypothetical protein
MNRPSLIYLLLLGTFPSFAAAEPLRLMSFNLRYANNGDKESRNWTHRRDSAAAIIKGHQAEVAGLQEALRGMLDDLAARLPDGLTPEAATTIPVAFFTAWYSLVTLAGLRRGEWVLIHGGAGGVGLAAIQIAQRAGAQIIDVILRDEIGHVAIGNHWFGWLCARRGLLPSEQGRLLARQYGAPQPRGPFNLQARLAAGFAPQDLAELGR